MPGKPVRRRTAKQPEPAIGDGVLARVVDRAFENPAMSGGLVVMALTATAIMSNAMFLQNGRHPEPLFNTRPPAVAREVTKAPQVMPLPGSRSHPPSAALPPAPRVVAPPVPQAKPIAEIPTAPMASAQPTPLASLIAAIQRELARRGVYSGAIDGVAGSRTRVAIATYEAASGLPATGEPTAELFAALKQPAAKPAPSASPGPPAAVVAAKPDQVAAAVERAAQLEREQAAARQADRLRRIQAALDQIGYGPLTADGQANSATADAIRRFELDNGLPVTGEASDRIVARLATIGAMKAN